MGLEFGPFNEVFEKGELNVPGHLVLMNVTRSEETTVVIRRIETALAHSAADEGLRRLLNDVNWRPHLAAAIAVWMLEDPLPYLPLVWGAIRAGSWVSPQLLVVAADRDPDFDRTAQKRLTELCAVQPPRGLTSAERHSATGPACGRGRSAKEASAILEVAAGKPWLAGAASDPALRELVAGDIDGGGQIASFWGHRVRDMLDGLRLRAALPRPAAQAGP